ncbi:MAG: 16S rRNA (adenine(1518)-N(6)/adenine(1519)-N(6))-dimethyltransferase RsmA [Pseudomonadales bacterium]
MSKPHVARRRFGQNFLCDPNIIQGIVNAIAPGEHDTIVEIGPGQGALTRPLLNAAGHLVVIEIDRDLAAELEIEFKTTSNFELHLTDALKFDLAELQRAPLRVVGNLPYNISTPLLFHLLDARQLISDMTFMLQQEVVDRMVAGPGSKEYGRLSVMMQYHCKVERLMTVPPGAFRPQPKVMSAIVRLQPRPETGKLSVQKETQLAYIVKAAFSSRRKTLRNNLRDVMSADQISQAGIDPGIRAEQLGVSEFIALLDQLSE